MESAGYDSQLIALLAIMRKAVGLRDLCQREGGPGILHLLYWV